MARGEAGRTPPKASQYAFSEKDYAWMDSKLTPQPNSIVRDAIKLTGAMQKVAKKTFIRAPKYPHASLPQLPVESAMLQRRLSAECPQHLRGGA